ncbi:hypothetical protein DFH07DRAFT_986885 [Mycena maculata]|uniref:Uncharacterized protein n=1 Tax=Mycena maculata TaxID=230809 RepID=A0AAD7MWW3_9AGAR|nr:hypothetical protein DFH07DRAFT_986885 [Mycena maculata]
MARLLFAFVALACMLMSHPLAAPLDHRSAAIPADQLSCGEAQSAALAESIQDARNNLSAINTASVLPPSFVSSFPRSIGTSNTILALQAQLALANATANTIAVTGDVFARTPPAATVAHVVADLHTAQTSLKGFVGNNATIAAVQAARASISASLINAQQVLAVDCDANQTVVAAP